MLLRLTNFLGQQSIDFSNEHQELRCVHFDSYLVTQPANAGIRRVHHLPRSQAKVELRCFEGRSGRAVQERWQVHPIFSVWSCYVSPHDAAC